MGKAISFLKRFLAFPADALIASSSILPNRVMRSPYLSDKFYSYKADQDSYVLLKLRDQDHEYGGFPIPPDHLRSYITCAETPKIFLNSGKEHFDIMQRILGKYDFFIDPASRLLDFGC